ncbi:MAG: aminopeptidase N [Planctomycetota bacterium]|jgi:aminopeptidase N
MTISLLLAGLASLLPLDDSETSGRPLPPEQACFDVQYYDLSVKVDPEEQRIDGTLRMQALLLSRTADLVLDLNQRLAVESVLVDGEAATFEHEGGEIRIHPTTALADVGFVFEVSVTYGGQPRVAPNPPWEGGLTWAQTEAGAPWIATSCQGQGADLWWPCKDQPSDEPKTMDIHITVPYPLVAASNGRLVGIDKSDAEWCTYNWHVSMPISTYSVALNIAPYQTIEREYTSIAGDTFPVIYYVLPDRLQQGEKLMEDILGQMAFMEKTFGPYPFRGDKYGVAETPHLGMEHQSIIAYGNNYRGNPWGSQHGFDFLHLHEFAHEWWANLVTAKDWKDFWIHESFATYSEALYVEEISGFEGYKLQMSEKRGGMLHAGPTAPRESRSTNQMYFSRETSTAPGMDIYNKGCWVLHTLRWQMGDEMFFKFLRRAAYPTVEMEAITDGGQCRFSNTEEIIQIAEGVAGEELDWFFELYLRQPELPTLHQEQRDGALHLRWEVPEGLDFPLPVQVRLGDALVRVDMPGGKGQLKVPTGTAVEVDPHAWILRTRESKQGADDE